MNATYKLQEELLTLSNEKFGVEKAREVATPEQLKKLKELGFNDYWLNTQSDRFKFPLLKLIHKSAIKEICKKYGLVYGPAGRFIGKIPKKNAEEILINSSYIKKVLSKKKEVIVDENNEIWQIYQIYNNYGYRRTNILERNKELIIKRKKKHFKMVFQDVEPELDIRVIAPPEEFDKKGYKIKNHKLKVKDPIVLVKINKNIFAVLTAWCPESMDANIFNENNN